MCALLFIYNDYDWMSDMIVE